jgi:D-alanyl-D-alanine carboxypeptidase/D-alanyl-D-alanine-endopeptidase (penicillin-binding protein 4)
MSLPPEHSPQEAETVPEEARWSRRRALGLIGGGALGASGLGWTVSAKGAEPTPGDTALMQTGQLADEDVAYIVFDPVDGTVLGARAAERAVIPASTLKVPTMVAGLAILGPDYRFPTILGGAGTIDGGVLHGDLTLLGGGDPYLDNGGLLEIVNQLKQTGIVSVDGRFVVDDTLLIPETTIDPTQPYGASYNPGLSALSLNFNRIQLSWQRQGDSVTGSALAVATARNIPCPWITVQAGPATPFRPIDGAEGWILSTRIDPSTGSNVLPVRYPSRLTAEVFQALCRQAGIVLPDPVAGAVPQGSVIVAAHESIPLVSMIPGILENSNNMAAETIGMMSARALVTRAIDRTQAAAILGQWFAQNVGGADWSSASLVAMCGLSTADRVTPSQMAAVLRFAHSSGRVPDIEALLPAMAWSSGKANERGLGPGRVRAKTGTMFWVRGLTGFVNCDSGKKRGFAIFLTDADRRAALSEAADPNDHGIPGGSRTWLSRAKNFERDLIASWAARH